jgi:hypothetical protein
MKVLVVVLLIALAACGKTSDVGAMQDEALGMVNGYKERFEMLDARLRDVLLRSTRISQQQVANLSDTPNVRLMSEDAMRSLADLKNEVAAAGNQIQNAAKGSNARTDVAHLEFKFKTEFERRYTELNAEIDAVELWISSVDLRSATRPAAPAPTPTPTPPPDNAPAGNGSAG